VLVILSLHFTQLTKFFLVTRLESDNVTVVSNTVITRFREVKCSRNLNKRALDWNPALQSAWCTHCSGADD